MRVVQRRTLRHALQHSTRSRKEPSVGASPFECYFPEARCSCAVVVLQGGCIKSSCPRRLGTAIPVRRTLLANLRMLAAPFQGQGSGRPVPMPTSRRAATTGTVKTKPTWQFYARATSGKLRTSTAHIDGLVLRFRRVARSERPPREFPAAENSPHAHVAPGELADVAGVGEGRFCKLAVLCPRGCLMTDPNDPQRPPSSSGF